MRKQDFRFTAKAVVLAVGLVVLSLGSYLVIKQSSRQSPKDLDQYLSRAEQELRQVEDEIKSGESKCQPYLQSADDGSTPGWEKARDLCVATINKMGGRYQSVLEELKKAIAKADVLVRSGALSSGQLVELHDRVNRYQVWAEEVGKAGADFLASIQEKNKKELTAILKRMEESGKRLDQLNRELR